MLLATPIDAIAASCCAAAITLIVTWMAGAFYYDLGRRHWLAAVGVVAWLAALTLLFVVWRPIERPVLLTWALFGVTLVWWFTQKPSHNRDWEPNVAVLPRVEIASGKATILHVRDTLYLPELAYAPRYETRVVHLQNLQSADLVLCDWGLSWMCHPLVIFDFGMEGSLCMSVEVRYLRGQKYAWIPTLFRQHELIYVVSTERDALRQRTRKGVGEQCVLYRLQADPLELSDLFLEYLDNVNAVSERPRWYHGLTANCTTSVYRQRQGRLSWNWRWLINGRLDKSLYAMGLLDRRFSLEQLRASGRITSLVGSDPSEYSGAAIRAVLAERQVL